MEGYERQIIEVSDRIQKYRDMTDQIIQGIHLKIKEAEYLYETATNPEGYNLDSCITMNKVKASVKNTFNHFSITWKEDEEQLNKAIRMELCNFRQFLKNKKSNMLNALAEDLDILSPVLKK